MEIIIAVLAFWLVSLAIYSKKTEQSWGECVCIVLFVPLVVTSKMIWSSCKGAWENGGKAYKETSKK